MEERMIQDFVHRISTDEILRKELASDPQQVIMREGFSPRVERVVLRMVPHLTIQGSIGTEGCWWRC